MIRTTLLTLALTTPLAGCAGSKREAADAVRCLATHPEIAKWAQDPEEAKAQVRADAQMIREAIKRKRNGDFQPTEAELARLTYAHALVQYVKNCLK